MERNCIPYYPYLCLHDNFHLWEQCYPEMEATDPRFIILVDRSSTMASPVKIPWLPVYVTDRLEAAKEVASKQVGEIFRNYPNALVSVMCFRALEQYEDLYDDILPRVQVVSPYTDKQQQVQEAIDLISVPMGDSPLAEALCFATDALRTPGILCSQGIDYPVYQEEPLYKYLYVYTDGGNDDWEWVDVLGPTCSYCFDHNLHVWKPWCNPWDCTEEDGTSCSDLQCELADSLTNLAETGVPIRVTYFGPATHEFAPDGVSHPDYTFLKYVGQNSGWFKHVSDDPEITIWVETHLDVGAGIIEGVSINVSQNDPFLELGGFDFLIAYDASALTLMDVLPGKLPEDCGWEYFTYRHGWQGNCEGPCPSGLVRIVAIADINNGPNHPSCFGPPDADPHELAEMKFYVTNDRTFNCQFVPIRFFWHDCGDNAISNRTGDMLWISDHVYDFEGNEVTGDIHYGGHWWLGDCDNPDTTKPDAIPFIDFAHGGIGIICSDSIDAPGDINLNEITNEIADAVLFTNYFIYGLAVFDVNPEGQVAATDVNNDGRVLTVGDLVYLIRIITGDALPYSKLLPYKHGASVSMLVNHSAVAVWTDSEADIGAAHFVFEHSGYEVGEPHLINGASDMAMKYNDEYGTLKIIVYSMEKGIKISAGAGNIFVIPISGTGTIELTETQLSDYHGNLLTITKDERPILPKRFELHQNYPNPFNASTNVTYELPEAAHVKIEVFNIMGQYVTTLLDAEERAGVHIVDWNGTDETGVSVASGIYLYRLVCDDFRAQKKMVLIK